ncbi:unnamed protein product [Gadus morhua 'NCC']
MPCVRSVTRPLHKRASPPPRECSVLQPLHCVRSCAPAPTQPTDPRTHPGRRGDSRWINPYKAPVAMAQVSASEDLC